MNRRATVSLCMIVKDEEETVLACLNSIKHLMDEMVVIDTGSVDRTIEVALSAGARVVNCPWSGNFSTARNFALDQANSDWILVLDADEVLEPVNPEEFYRLLAAPLVEGYYLHLNSYLGTGRELTRDQVVRLFRNRPEYRFSGSIHEQVTASILKAGQGQGLAVAPLTIHHYGYLEAQLLKKNKSERNISILVRELEHSPHNPFLLYCLGMEHYQREEVQQGLDCLEKALALMQGNEGYFIDVLLHITLGLLKAGHLVKLITFTGKTLAMLPENGDILAARGLGYLALGCYQEAIENLEHSLQKGSGIIIPDFKILSCLGDACNLAGCHDRAGKAYLSALQRSPRLLYPLTQILGLLQQGKSGLNWKCISSFAPWDVKSELGNELLKAKQFQLALVVLTLALYDWVNSDTAGEEMINLSEKISNILSDNEIAWSCRSKTLPYAVTAGREINTYALLLGREHSCSNNHLTTGFRLLVERFLFILVSEFYPRWKPEIKLPESSGIVVCYG